MRFECSWPYSDQWKIKSLGLSTGGSRRLVLTQVNVLNGQTHTPGAHWGGNVRKPWEWIPPSRATESSLPSLAISYGCIHATIIEQRPYDLQRQTQFLSGSLEKQTLQTPDLEWTWVRKSRRSTEFLGTAVVPGQGFDRSESPVHNS